MVALCVWLEEIIHVCLQCVDHPCFLFELCAFIVEPLLLIEKTLLFCLQRPDIFSFDDLAIQRGLRMVYHHRKIDRKLFEKYRRRFSPYCSVASLYLWAVAGGAIPGMKDYAPKKNRGK